MSCTGAGVQHLAWPGVQVQECGPDSQGCLLRHRGCSARPARPVIGEAAWPLTDDLTTLLGSKVRLLSGPCPGACCSMQQCKDMHARLEGAGLIRLVWLAGDQRSEEAVRSRLGDLARQVRQGALGSLLDGNPATPQQAREQLGHLNQAGASAAHVQHCPALVPADLNWGACMPGQVHGSVNTWVMNVCDRLSWEVWCFAGACARHEVPAEALRVGVRGPGAAAAARRAADAARHRPVPVRPLQRRRQPPGAVPHAPARQPLR